MPDTSRWRIRTEIAALVGAELSTARPSDDRWPALERAHLLSQPWAWTHTRVHLAMLRLAIPQNETGASSSAKVI